MSLTKFPVCLRSQQVGIIDMSLGINDSQMGLPKVVHVEVGVVSMSLTFNERANEAEG